MTVRLVYKRFVQFGLAGAQSRPTLPTGRLGMKVSTIQRRCAYMIAGTAVLAFFLAFASSVHGAEDTSHKVYSPAPMDSE